MLIKVGVHIARTQMLPTVSKLSWETYNEDTFSLGGSSRMTFSGLLEQINVTRDTSDYLWYTTRWAWNYVVFSAILFIILYITLYRMKCLWLSLEGNTYRKLVHLDYFMISFCILFSVGISSSEAFLRGGQKPTLFVKSAGPALHVFINGQFSGQPSTLQILVFNFRSSTPFTCKFQLNYSSEKLNCNT